MLKRAPDLLRDWNLYLGREIQVMIKSFTKRRNKKSIHTDIWLKVILQYCPEFFGLFRLFLVYFSSLLLIPACSGWFWVGPHFFKKVKARKVRKNRKARKKQRHVGM